jgi:hypothetical protein
MIRRRCRANRESASRRQSGGAPLHFPASPLQPWRWTQYVCPKRRLPTSIQGSKTQKNIITSPPLEPQIAHETWWRSRNAFFVLHTIINNTLRFWYVHLPPISPVASGHVCSWSSGGLRSWYWRHAVCGISQLGAVWSNVLRHNQQIRPCGGRSPLALDTPRQSRCVQAHFLERRKQFLFKLFSVYCSMKCDTVCTN